MSPQLISRMCAEELLLARVLGLDPNDEVRDELDRRAVSPRPTGSGNVGRGTKDESRRIETVA